MNLLVKLFFVATLVHLTVAVTEKTKYDFRDGQYLLHREPPVDMSAVFDVEEVEVRWIEQPLNHFDPQDERTWRMRYLENDLFLQDGGPIFIYVGGEWTVSKGWLQSGHMHDMARDLNGTMFYTEHRYYGESRPVPDLTMDNLRYLNIDQALADLAHFIVHVREIYPLLKDSKVILVGASYSATMVTWFPQKYPHLVSGTWASSAPLEAKVDFIEYKEVVADAIETLGGSRCTARISRAFEQLERLVAENETEKIEEIFRLCYPLDLSEQIDVWNFFDDIAGPFSGIVQYHRETSQNIQKECAILVDNDIEDDVEALSSWWWHPMDPKGPEDFCYNHHFNRFISRYNGTTWDSLAAISEVRQWIYQTCAEYGWYQTSGSDRIPFGSNFPVNISYQMCNDFYSGVFTPERIQKNVARTNVIYGAKNPAVRNVYSTHGQFDPWSPMGVHEDINEHSPTVILPNETHCSDLYSRGVSDTLAMRENKDRIFGLVQQWLGLEVPVVPTVLFNQN